MSSVRDSIVNSWHNSSSSSVNRKRRRLQFALVVVVVLMNVATPAAVAQQPSSVILHGSVLTATGTPVEDALVTLERTDVPGVVETKTNAAGLFSFLALPAGNYRITSEKSGLRSRPASILASSSASPQLLALVLDSVSPPSPSSSTQAMEFADNPNFTVAGVTDWTAVGGHGSDSTLRTSEDLAREALALKPQGAAPGASQTPASTRESDELESKLRGALAGAPGSFAANHQLGDFYLHAGKQRESVPLLLAAFQIEPSNRDNEYDLARAYQETGNSSQARDHVQKLLATRDEADLHRLLGELDEQMGDPLAAVHEEEHAVRLDPNEQNYFEWGSELLLHRAVWQAAEVFKNGAKAYPGSARMLAALGAALFAGDLYEDAAANLCAASDLNPADPEPYTFMGRVEMASPKPLACIEPRLARFVHQQPGNSTANYLYAMAIWKRQQQTADPQALHQVETLLTRAVAIDAGCADAYLQLGILSSAQHHPEEAISYYNHAIAADPQLGEAHYRLGMAYDRMGAPEKARQEFQLHDEIEAVQAATVERQRRELKQFLVVLQQKPSSVH
jgi:tetratricopeptide (TPR) repeat protein